jgi:hypothetical protein
VVECAVLRPKNETAQQAAYQSRKAGNLVGKMFSYWRLNRQTKRRMSDGAIFLGFTADGKTLVDGEGGPVENFQIRAGDILIPKPKFQAMMAAGDIKEQC